MSPLPWAKSLWTALAAIMISAVPLKAQSTNTAAANPQTPTGAAYRTSEILIKFKPGATEHQVADVVRLAGITSARHILTPAMEDAGDIGITRATINLPVAQAVQALQNHPAVEYAQPNWVYHHLTTGTTVPTSFDDTYFVNGSMWGTYDANDTATTDKFGSGAVAAWAAGFTGSPDVYVGIIDEGLQFDHPDLAPNVWTNPDEVAGDNIDNDSDGYVDDVHGWNALNDNGTIYDASYDDHGTHVSGTIGAVGANGTGTSGLNWNVRIISGKFLGSNGGSTADAIQAIDYMTTLKSRKGLNIVALNNSWGGGGFDQSLLDAITRAANANILFVAAAGNGNIAGMGINTDAQANYPSCYDTTAGAGYDSVVSVTAIDSTGAKAGWANYGATTVDLGAPGVGIWSTLPGGSYGSYDGTSMATPHVTGAIALYASAYPSATPAQIKQALLNSTTPTDSLNGITASNGRLNVWNFLNTPPAPGVAWSIPPSAPLAPTAASATAVSSSEIDIAWTDASDNETGFKVVRSDGWSTIVGANRTRFANKGLTAGASYTYSVLAYNAAGESMSAAAGAATTWPATGPTPTASFVGKDTTTKGNWQGRYGAAGYNIIGDSEKDPLYTTLAPEGNSVWGWATFSPSTTDSRALQSAVTANARGCWAWYSSGTFTVDVNFTDPYNHRIALYCVDWDTSTRAETIEVLDPNYNTVLSTQSLSSFNGGAYMIWEVTGHVLFRFTRTGGKNAVVSALFFDTPPAPSSPTGLTASAGLSTVSGNAAIALKWTAGANATSYNIKRRQSATDPYVTIATVTGTSYSNPVQSSGNTTYDYVVSSINGVGESANSAAASAQPSPVPGSFKAAAAPKGGTLNLSWTDRTSDESGFRIERLQADGVTWSWVKNTTAGATSYTDSGLKSGTTYWYRVSAFTATATTQPATASGTAK